MNKKYYVNSLIVVLLMICTRFIPPLGSMTPLGMTILGIFLGALYGWITCDMIWPSILALIMLGFTDYAENVGSVFTQGMSNGVIQLIIWLLVFSAVLTTSGISKVLVTKLVGSKLCQGHPWRLSFIIMLAVWFCAAFGAGFAAILLTWQFVYSIAEQVGYTKKDKWPRMMICGIIFFNALGALSLPFQAGVAAVYGYLGTASEGKYGEYNFGQYIIFTYILCICVMAVYMLLCRFLINPDVSKLTGDIKIEKTEPMNTKQKIAAVALLAILILTIVPSVLSPGPAKAFLTRFGTNAIVLALIAVITFLRDKEGKPYFTFKELANQGLIWNLVFMVATATVVGGALASQDCGFTGTIISACTPILGNVNGFGCAAIIATITMLLTNVINNSVATAIMIPVMYPFAQKYGINPTMMAALIGMCANCGLLLPCASPAGALLHGNKEWVSSKNAVLYSLLGIAALLGMAIIVGIPLGTAIFK